MNSLTLFGACAVAIMLLSYNDFQMDDLALLEQVTDEAVRVSVQQVGLDSSKIVPPMTIQGHQLRRQVRRSFLPL